MNHSASVRLSQVAISIILTNICYLTVFHRILLIVSLLPMLGLVHLRVNASRVSSKLHL